ncbi:Endonuclease/exonuclease/phosphatase [Endogone sp. FLAS-F59071]|nr:Endonuclease/exonuclease/phosphatase [Endogone sp. FLAS-F59071]|eukprot:RUS19350.1 Endonuclease/exonuclease/phosphatase [Endogone sp. FLAS-F59071]
MSDRHKRYLHQSYERRVRSHHRARSQDGDYERDRDREGGGEQRDRDQERARERERNREQEGNQEQNTESDYDRERDHDRDRDREHEDPDRYRSQYFSSNQDRYANTRSSYSQSSVRGDSPITREWVNVAEASPNKFDLAPFTITSYNVLADSCLQKTRELYQHALDSELAWDQRGLLVFEELKARVCDIYCLQEVDIDHYQSGFQKAFDEMGFDGVYKRRSEKGQSDGCAVFVKRERFQIEQTMLLEYNQNGYLDRGNVAIILILKDLQAKINEHRQICIANTHLLFNTKRGVMKLAQLDLLFRTIQQELKGRDVPIVLCGDMNSTPDSLVSTFIKDGAIDIHFTPLNIPTYDINETPGQVDMTVMSEFYMSGQQKPPSLKSPGKRPAQFQSTMVNATQNSYAQAKSTTSTTTSVISASLPPPPPGSSSLASAYAQNGATYLYRHVYSVTSNVTSATMPMQPALPGTPISSFTHLLQPGLGGPTLASSSVQPMQPAPPGTLAQPLPPGISGPPPASTLVQSAPPRLTGPSGLSSLYTLPPPPVTTGIPISIATLTPTLISSINNKVNPLPQRRDIQNLSAIYSFRNGLPANCRRKLPDIEPLPDLILTHPFVFSSAYTYNEGTFTSCHGGGRLACDFIFFGGWKNPPQMIAAAVSGPSAVLDPPVPSNIPIARAPINAEKDTAYLNLQTTSPDVPMTETDAKVVSLSRYNVRLLSRLEIPVDQLKDVKALPVTHRGLPSDHIALAARFEFERNLR